MENNKIELEILEEAIERQLEAIKNIVKLINDIGDACEEEAEKLVDQNMEKAINDVQEANNHLGKLVKGKDLKEQGYSVENELKIALQLEFVCHKIGEINRVLNLILK